MLPRTLSTRIALLAGLLSLAGAATLSVILISSQRAEVLREMTHGSEGIAETIRLSINHDMLANRREGVREVIESVAEHSGIAGVRLFNKEGRISYSSRAEEVGQVVDKQAEACVTCHRDSEPFQHLDLEDRSRVYTDPDGRTLLATIQVIRNERGCQGSSCHKQPSEQSVLGVLDVAMSLESTHERLFASTRGAVMVSFGGVILLAGILFVAIRRSVRQPVDRMIAATGRVAGGDYDQQVPSDATDEIGFLARSFNEMIKSLNSSQNHLEEWAGTLENKLAHKAEELRALQFQVVQAEKLSSVGLVAAGIAHELNSPLMAIVTFAHLVQKKLEPDSQAFKDLHMILHEADRCAAIIRNLLDFSRDDTHGPQLEPCEINKLIEKSLELLKVEIRNHGIEVDTSLLPDLPIVEASAVQLTQVLVNLLINAVQAMPDGGHITIRTDVVPRESLGRIKLPPSHSTEFVRIRVRDTGSGIAPEDLRKVFDPFFTTKPVGQGSGLGLSVSHGIITRYRGTVCAKSDGRAETEFTVLLPVAELSIERANDDNEEHLDPATARTDGGRRGGRLRKH